MSATVAAALKKIAVAVLTDKKLQRTVLGIVLGVIIIIIMPVAAVISLFNGGAFRLFRTNRFCFQAGRVLRRRTNR